jgi:hypothetical protein
MTPYHYRDQLVYWRNYCGAVFEVFINHLSIGLSHVPADYAKRVIDSLRSWDLPKVLTQQGPS